LLEAGAKVTAVEIDPVLTHELSVIVAERAPDQAPNLVVINLDAMKVVPEVVRGVWEDEPVADPTSLVANLPYNVAVPVVLHVLEVFPSIRRVLVMVQAEVAERIVAPPGSRTYGIPSAKVAWYASARKVGTVGRSAFWPVPRVDNALVLLERRDTPSTTARREDVFRVIDAAFSQRRKGLRSALAGLAGTADMAGQALLEAGFDPLTRGERLGVSEFARLTELLTPFRGGPASGTVGT
jgi:16S rRNA (adenine1518-N6/adenine1519-N6)-dimethyltransferase